LSDVYIHRKSQHLLNQQPSLLVLKGEQFVIHTFPQSLGELAWFLSCYGQTSITNFDVSHDFRDCQGILAVIK
jgi:hypothetical protein